MSRWFRSNKLIVSTTALAAVVILGVALLPQLQSDESATQTELSQAEARAAADALMAKKAAKRADRETRKLGRDEFWFRALRDPATGTIPADIHERERAHAMEVRKNTPASKVDNFIWMESGPNDVGGRVRGLAVDNQNSNTVLAGGASGGLWKTTDGGTSWALKTPSHHAVSTLVQDPRAGQNMTWYYGTGEVSGSAQDRSFQASYFGTGLYKSTDNGETWTLMQAATSTVALTTQYAYIEKVAVSPTTGTVFLASNGFGLWRSTDGGASFTAALGTSPGEHKYSDVDVASDGTVVACLSQEDLGDSTPTMTPGIYKSTDDGLNWTAITPGTFPATHGRTVIDVAPSNADVMYAMTHVTSNDVRMHKITISSGASLNRSGNIPNFGPQVGEPNTQGSYNMVIAVKPNDENFVIFGWTNLHRSDDGVATAMTDADKHWIGGYATVNDISQYANHHPDNHAVAFDPSSPNTVWSGHDGGLSRVGDITAAGAVVWEGKNNAFNVTQFYAISQHPAAGDGRLAGGTQDNGTPFWSNTLSAAPTASTDVSSGDGGYSYLGATVAYVESQEGNLLEYYYDGASMVFDGAVKPPGANALFVHPFAVDEADETKVYFPSDDHIFRMQTQNLGSPSGGQDTTPPVWQELTNVSVGAGFRITAIEVSRTGHTLYMAGFRGGDPPKMFRLDNANTATDGEIDISIPGLPANAYPHGIAVNPTNAMEVMAVFSNYNVVGTYHSTDGGANWTAVEGNLIGEKAANSGPSVRGAGICPGNNGSSPVYLLATSTGVYSTQTLNGASTVWEPESDTGMGLVVANDIDVRTSDGTVAVGTHGRGAWQGRKDLTVPVALASFDLFAGLGEVSVSWTMSFEQGNLGYHILRAEGASENFRRITREMIPAGSASGSYEFIDKDVQAGVEYSYRLESVEATGETQVFHSQSVRVAPSKQLVLHGAHPNPFNPMTTIEFEVPRTEAVRLTVYDAQGRKVRTLVNGMLEAKRHAVTWDGRDDSGQSVASGVYMYQVSSATTSLSEKMVLTK